MTYFWGTINHNCWKKDPIKWPALAPTPSPSRWTVLRKTTLLLFKGSGGIYWTWWTPNRTAGERWGGGAFPFIPPQPAPEKSVNSDTCFGGKRRFSGQAKALRIATFVPQTNIVALFSFPFSFVNCKPLLPPHSNPRLWGEDGKLVCSRLPSLSLRGAPFSSSQRFFNFILFPLILFLNLFLEWNGAWRRRHALKVFLRFPSLLLTLDDTKCHIGLGEALSLFWNITFMQFNQGKM